MTTNAPTPTPGRRSFAQVLMRRTVVALVALLFLLVPTAVLFVITKQPSATYAAMGAIVGVVAVVAGGRRIGVLTSIVLGLLAPIAIVAGLSPVTGAALMALVTLMVGRLSLYGLHRATMLVPVFLTWPMLAPVPWLTRGSEERIHELLTKSGLSLTRAVNALASGSAKAGSPSPAVTNALIHQRFDSTYLAWVALFFFVGAIIPVLVLPLAMRNQPAPKPSPNTRGEALEYTVIITLLTAGATFYFLNHPKYTTGSFLIATILVLTQVGNDIQWKLTIQRVLGTLGGVLLLSGVIALVGNNSYTLVLGIPMPMKLYAVGLLFGTAAIIAKFSPRVWIYYVLIAPTTALLNAFTTIQARNVGKDRLIDNLVGAALVIAASVIALTAGRIMSRNSSETATENPTEALAP